MCKNKIFLQIHQKCKDKEIMRELGRVKACGLIEEHDLCETQHCEINTHQ